MQRLLLIAAIISISTAITFSQQAQEVLRPHLGEKVGTCNACGMDVFEKMLTKVEITADDDTLYACGIGCAFGMTEGKDVTSMKVVNFTNVSMIEAQEAYYVTGSRLTPVRAMMPVFVFGSDKDAEEFVNKYGGTIYDYIQFKELTMRIRGERGR